MIVYRKTPANHTHSILYLMGATWKHDTMFGSVFTEHNMQDLLYKSGIETISVEYEKHDTFYSLLNEIKLLSQESDYILGYSFGCYLAIASATKNIKGIILLDPNVPTGNSGEKYITNIDTANKFFERDILNKNLNLKPRNIVGVNYKPEISIIFSEYGYKNNEMFKIQKYLDFYKKVDISFVENSSHFLMLEPARFELTKKILEFMGKKTTLQ